MNTKKLVAQNCVIAGAYWASVCAAAGFASVLLLSKGFSSSQIGVALAIGNILGVICQPIVGSIADSSKKIGLHALTTVLSIAAMIFFFALMVVPNVLIATGAVFVLTLATVQTIQPLANSVSVYYIDRGIDLDFGIARGVGSLVYAVASKVIGVLVEAYSENVIMIAGILFYVILAVTLFFMPRLDVEVVKDNSEKKEAPKQGLLAFVKKYKFFCMTLIGGTLALSCHNMCNTYMINIVRNLGGDTDTMGTSMAIAAVVELPIMFIFTKLLKKFKASQLIAFSTIMFAVKVFAFLVAPSVPVLYAACVLQIFTFGLYIPAGVYYAKEKMQEQDAFKGQALMAGTNTLGGVIGSLIGGIMIDAGGVEIMLQTALVMAVVGCVFAVIFAGKTDEASLQNTK